MSDYRLEIRVTPRPGLLDPEGNAIEHALHSLGFLNVTRVRVGRIMSLDVGADSAAEARAQGEAMCRKLLANPVTQDYTVGVVGEPAEAGGVR
ncbi:MAG: phosphoribosylformylglycinamidine synthase subunit PurS [Gemmatimonadetes bacterium]|nr:phosphoribosylformylglycinamidine synthase subunit PurS [Gemmatimonadota bacterium]